MRTTDDESVGFVIGEAARLLRERFDDYARTRGVTRSQWLVLLAVMRQEPVSQVKLARYLEVEPMSLCRMADRLQAAGMVERHPDPEDRRIRLVSLSPKARELVAELRGYGAKVVDFAVGGLSASQKHALMESLETVCDRLNSEEIAGILAGTLAGGREGSAS